MDASSSYVNYCGSLGLLGLLSFCFLFEFTTVNDFNWCSWGSRPRTYGFKLVKDLHTFDDFAENYVPAIEMGSSLEAKEEL